MNLPDFTAEDLNPIRIEKIQAHRNCDEEYGEFGVTTLGLRLIYEGDYTQDILLGSWHHPIMNPTKLCDFKRLEWFINMAIEQNDMLKTTGPADEWMPLAIEICLAALEELVNHHDKHSIDGMLAIAKDARAEVRELQMRWLKGLQVTHE